MKKSLLFAILIIFAVLLLLIILKPRSLLQRIGPDIGEVVYAEADAVGSKTQQEIALTIDNNLFPIHVDSLYLVLWLEGTNILKSKRRKDIDLEAFSEDTLNLSATFRHKEIYEIVKKANEQNRDSLQTTLEGTLYYRFPLLGKTEIPFSEELKIRTPQLLEISLAELKVEETDLPDIKLEAQLEVINRDTLEFTILQLDYNLNISDSTITAEGTTGENTVVEGEGTTMLEIPIETSLGIVGDGLVQFIEEGSDWPYSMNTTVKLDTGMDIIKIMVMNMQIKDTIDVIDSAQQLLD